MQPTINTLILVSLFLVALIFAALFIRTQPAMDEVNNANSSSTELPNDSGRQAPVDADQEDHDTYTWMEELERGKILQSVETMTPRSLASPRRGYGSHQ